MSVGVNVGVNVGTPGGKGVGVRVSVGVDVMVAVRVGVKVRVGEGGRVSGNTIERVASRTAPLAVVTRARMVIAIP